MTVLDQPIPAPPATASPPPERSLTQRLHETGALTPVSCERLLRDHGTALADLHRASGVHGVVAPDTVWLDQQDRGRLDAGSDPASSATSADDQSGLAAVLAAALIGRRLGTGEAPATAVADRVPERLRTVIGRASNPDPAGRFPDVDAFVAAYGAAVDATVVALGHAVNDAVITRDQTSARALRAVGLGFRPEDRTLLELGPQIDALGSTAPPSLLDLDAADARALLDINTFVRPAASSTSAPSPWMPLLVAIGVVAFGLLVVAAFAIGAG